MNTAYLSLGSNEGNRQQMLDSALAYIVKDCGNISLQSCVYETAAWGLEDQPEFLNMTVAITSALTAKQLLTAIRNIETLLGRKREIEWGQRNIDIDILFYNNDIIDTTDLVLPHPRLHERRFVLVPLMEIAPGFVHPILHKSITALLKECEDDLEVEQIN
ncbi:MAG: 2-amino-4-hydroxy-6-hydroxymethyldihydropteridine diphosphokinase [Taibaiella sp.]|nr:2-amino-4-hydroxy-6-hydroxymethyldihydropteridine diphosphokinase [Taibaiella sp.]